jgi:signal transduction histidine kinase
MNTPAVSRSPARHSQIDAVIAAVVVAIQVTASVAVTTLHPGDPYFDGALAGYLLLAAGGAALFWRRRYPVAVLTTTLVFALFANALGAKVSYLALIVAFFTAVLTGHRRAAIISLVIGYLFSVVPGLVPHGNPGPSLAFALGLFAWLAVLFCAAELVRARNQRAVEQAQAREEELERKAMAERLAIARDLHDIVAHNISIINVQANTALHLMDRQPERARQALTAIHEVSRQALTELRSVLGVLRPGEAADPPRAPGPGIDQLEDLATRARSAGLQVHLTRQGEPVLLPAEVSLAAYRIVQEALTNAARHAPGCTATVQITYAGGTLTIEVDNDAPVPATVAARPAAARPPERDPGTGSGIAGMAERAQALGGTLQTARRPDGGFGVLATLPIEGSR